MNAFILLVALHRSILAPLDNVVIVSVTAAAPTERDAVLLVGFWNHEVLLRDFHLVVGEAGFAHAYFELLQKLEKRCDQVFTKVKVVVVHHGGQE